MLSMISISERKHIETLTHFIWLIIKLVGLLLGKDSPWENSIDFYFPGTTKVNKVNCNSSFILYISVYFSIKSRKQGKNAHILLDCFVFVVSNFNSNWQPFYFMEFKIAVSRHPMAYGTEQRTIKEEYVKDCFVFENHIFKKWNTDAMYCLIKASQEFIPKRDVI